ncbi:ABC transporter [Pluralibacter gergoviae]|uniref:ABC transporter ATP-binding protein n=1 Tax=Pluralibacter gergoviae TaxID=61647 RepID=UPI0003296F56|nr:ABC transporter ATP-binding protein [Pluralibacter gergoviae]KMK19424.1 ABC transporter [Pluralibacter gergoviae]
MPLRPPPRADGLVLDALTAGYGQTRIIDNVSFSIPAGRLTALVGPNGSGKSTLLMTLARLLQPQAGCVWLDGERLHRQPTKALARRLAILPQSPAAPEGLTVFELVSRGRYPWQGLLHPWRDADEEAVNRALRLTGTEALAHLPVERLSGGQRQRCWIAMALAQQTPVILLDEPTAWLDLRYQVEILELLRALTRDGGRTIVVVLHDLNFAVNYADTLLFLRQGRLLAAVGEGEPCTPEIVSAAFDIEVQAMVNPQTGKPFFIPFGGGRP